MFIDHPCVDIELMINGALVAVKLQVSLIIVFLICVRIAILKHDYTIDRNSVTTTIYFSVVHVKPINPARLKILYAASRLMRAFGKPIEFVSVSLPCFYDGIFWPLVVSVYSFVRV